jgi:hypothetical protein
MAKLKTDSKKIIILLMLCSFIASCTFTTTKEKDPEFKVDLNAVENNLKTLVTCEHINLSGTEKKTNNQISSEFEIRIINGVNLPTDDTQLKVLGKAIASQLKGELKNENPFNTYKMLFVIQQTTAGATSSNYTGWVLKSEEL